MRQSKRIAINTATSWVGMFTSAAIAIFLTKFLLNKLGPDAWGMFRYIIALESTLFLLDLGLGSTINRFASQLLSAGNIKRLNATISFAALIFLAVGVLAVIVMVGLAMILPTLVPGNTPELYSQGFRLMICIGLGFAVRFLAYAPQGVLFGSQRYDVVNIIKCLTEILRAALTVVLLLRLETPALVVFGYVFLSVSVLWFLLVWIFAKRQVPQLNLSIRFIRKDVIKEVLGFSVFVFIMAITTMLIVHTPTFFIGRFFGTAYVAYYSLTFIVLSQIQRVSAGFAFPLIPVAGKYGVLGDQAALQKIMIRGTKFCAIMCFPIGVLAAIFAQPLFEWFKEGYGWTWVLLAIMVFPLLVRTTERVSGAVLVGAGSVKWVALGQILVVAAIGFLCWLFAKRFNMGLYGIALGWAIPVFLFSATFKSLYACWQVKLRWLRYMGQAYGRVILGIIPSAVLAILLVRYAYPTTFFMIVIEVLPCLAIYTACSWWFILMPDERRQILALFQRKLPSTENIDNQMQTQE